MPNTYIDLKRTFTEINSDTEFDSKDSAELFEFFNYGNNIYWDDIIRTENISVILGEAGSGKSTEFKNQCSRLTGKSNYSFFIELENLINKHDFSVIDPDNESKFKEWVNGNERAIFFLDSIDESKFTKRSDFKDSLYNFKRLVGLINLDRCKIILSSRFSEWHPGTDLKLIEELIPEVQSEYKKAEIGEPEIDSQKDLFEVHQESSTKNETERIISIYRFNPLNRFQVKKLAEHYLVEHTDDFVDAIDNSYAWSLATRPLDVVGLIYIWEEKGELGSFKEILDHHIKNGLAETAERQDIDELPFDRAYEGVKCLAAAVMLSKKQKFYPIESEREISDSKIILPRSCLPKDWNDKEIKFLLQRRLFDKATFNTIKFHLRSLTEYLAALWFKNRLDSDGDYLSVREILFKNEGEELIIKESFKPIIAWLAIGDRPWNERIRQDIVTAFPELFLKYGDPSKLPKQYLLSIMHALRQKYGESRRIYADDIVRSLSYLGNVEFATDFEEWLRDSEIGEHFKNLLLRIALHSKMKGLSDVSKDIAIDESFYSRTRNSAIHYLGEVGSKKYIINVIEYLFSENNLNNQTIGASIEAFYPDYLNNKELFILLKKTNNVEEYSLGIGYQLKNHIEAIAESLSTQQLTDLVENLTTLSQEPPLDGFLPYSKKYYWIGDSLFVATKHLLKRDPKNWDIIAQAIYHLNCLKRAAVSTNDIEIAEIEELENNAKLRRSYFWYCYKRLDKDRKKEHPHLHQIFGGFSSVSKLKISDIEWLIEDSRIPGKRNYSLKFIKKYWDFFRRPIGKLYYYRNLRGDDKELKSLFSISVWFYIQNYYKDLKHKYGIYNWSHWIEEKKFSFKRKRDTFREQKIIYKNIRRIWKGEHVRLLLHLTSNCMTDSAKYTGVEIKKLEDKFSRLVAWSFRSGVKKYWHTFTPSLPHLNSNRTDGRTIVGFAGIYLAIKGNELDFRKITNKKAQQLVNYAINELNGFPFWLEELTNEKPESVAKVFQECIDKDWVIQENEGPTITVLSKIRTSGKYIIPFISDYLYEKLSNTLPTNLSVIRDSLGILVVNNDAKLTDICKRNIYRDGFTNKEFLLWIGILNQFPINNALRFVQNVINKINRELHLWYGLWIQLDAEEAIKAINELLEELNENQKTNFIVGLCSNLESRADYGFPVIEEPNYLNEEVFQTWYKMVYKYVDPQDDIIRQGSYSPGSRDYAQDFRGHLLDRFIQLHPKETKQTLDDLSNDPSLKHLKDQLKHRRDATYQVFADQEVWEPEDIPTFMVDHEVDPKSTYDLYQIILKRLKNIKDEIERDEHGLNLNSLKNDLIAGDDEAELRKFLTRQLKKAANEKYIVTAEEELNPEVDPDIRIHKNKLDPISIEIKWAQRWTGRQLFDKIESQLVDQYLRASNCNYGIYVVGYINEEGKNNNWQDPVSQEMLSFDQSVKYLKEKAVQLMADNSEIRGLEVVDINFES